MRADGRECPDSRHIGRRTAAAGHPEQSLQSGAQPRRLTASLLRRRLFQPAHVRLQPQRHRHRVGRRALGLRRQLRCRRSGRDIHHADNRPPGRLPADPVPLRHRDTGREHAGSGLAPRPGRALPQRRRGGAHRGRDPLHHLRRPGAGLQPRRGRGLPVGIAVARRDESHVRGRGQGRLHHRPRGACGELRRQL